MALTNNCDLSCKFCFVPKNPAELDFRNVVTWLDELDENGCLGVGLGGGEPILFPHLIKICEHAAENTRLAVTLTTHGHLVNDKLVAALIGKVHFVRVIMDGVNGTYELSRGRSFANFRTCLDRLRLLAPFGINYLVNSRTLPELDEAIAFAVEAGAVELLLLPEQPVSGFGGIEDCTKTILQKWVAGYHGPIPLTVSETGAEGLPTCNPLPEEKGLQAYAHIDAFGVLKRNSFDREGVIIRGDGVTEALHLLERSGKEATQ